MSIYAGMDVSDKSAHICVVAEGALIKRDVVAIDPDVPVNGSIGTARIWLGLCWRPAHSTNASGYRIS
jgi:hypothetical protein